MKYKYLVWIRMNATLGSTLLLESERILSVLLELVLFQRTSGETISLA